MFMPQAKPNRPLLSGVNSTVVLAIAGSNLLSAKSGNTTRDVHSPPS